MPTRHVVLAHGIFRFDALRIFLRDHANLDIGPRYFDGIADFLRLHNFVVHEPDVDFAGPLARRASDLTARLDAILATTGGDAVHIIGHSMGGLDARMAIAEHPALTAKVRCLTTIGTPHHGTTSADTAALLGGRLLIASLLPLIDLEGFEDLTTSKCRAFNERVRDVEAKNTVRYRTVAATEDLPRVIPLLQPTWIQLDLAEGPSDGIVPRSSQAWVPALVSSDGAVKPVEQLSFPMPADHLNEVGVWDPGELLVGVTKSVLEQRVKDFYLHLSGTE